LRKQYAWLLIIAVIGSFIWLYLDTVNKTTHSNRIWTLQTLASQESKETVLSLTLTDGSNVKYIVKLLQADQRATKEPISKETVSSFDLEKQAQL